MINLELANKALQSGVLSSDAEKLLLRIIETRKSKEELLEKITNQPKTETKPKAKTKANKVKAKAKTETKAKAKSKTINQVDSIDVSNQIDSTGIFNRIKNELGGKARCTKKTIQKWIDNEPDLEARIKEHIEYWRKRQ